MGTTTWRTLLHGAMENMGDPGPVVGYAPDEATFDSPVDSGGFMTAWTATSVYLHLPYTGEEPEFLVSTCQNPRRTGHGRYGHEGGPS